MVLIVASTSPTVNDFGIMNLHVIYVLAKTQKGASYLGLEIVGRLLDCPDFSTIKATLVGYLSVASSAHFFLRAISKQVTSNTFYNSLTERVLLFEALSGDVERLRLHQLRIMVDRLCQLI